MSTKCNFKAMLLPTTKHRSHTSTYYGKCQEDPSMFTRYIKITLRKCTGVRFKSELPDYTAARMVTGMSTSPLCCFLNSVQVTTNCIQSTAWDVTCIYNVHVFLKVPSGEIIALREFSVFSSTPRSNQDVSILWNSL